MVEGGGGGGEQVYTHAPLGSLCKGSFQGSYEGSRVPWRGL